MLRRSRRSAACFHAGGRVEFLEDQMTYAEKLKDPRWQKKRLRILERDAFACHMQNLGVVLNQIDAHPELASDFARLLNGFMDSIRSKTPTK